jgi:HEPN domain-containing protein
MTKQNHIDYWLASANDDWQTVLSLFDAKRFAHSLFFAHLVLEKYCKAHWVKNNTDNIPPRTHNLVKLISETSVLLSTEKLDFLRQFNDFQLDGRYPKMCTPEYTKQLLKTVNIIVKCLIKQIS